MAHSKPKKLVVILGPTAVGKTALSIGLATHLKTEIISSDSRQVFTELNIGVARPTEEELSAVKHHFIAFRSVEEDYSAGMFARDALNLVDELFLKYDTLVCCGGSMLYVDALLNGLDDLPSNPQIRQELQRDFEQYGISHLQEKLKELDETYFHQVDLQNPHRLMRAIEVCLASGRTYSELRKANPQTRSFQTIKIGLTAERNLLYERINKRVDMMIESGLIEEAKSVVHLAHLNSLNTTGYKELFPYFNGEISKEEAIEKIKQHTRNFAKRQLTWWQRDTEIQWIEIDKENDLLKRALTILDE